MSTLSFFLHAILLVQLYFDGEFQTYAEAFP